MMKTMDFEERTKRLLADEQIEKLHNSNVIVFGLGGVGGYAVEMLVRAGVGNLTVVDFDKVDVTNINRQIIATTLSVGMLKTEAVCERAKIINPSINIRPISKRISEENLSEFNLGDYDFIIDAIDSVADKLALIKEAKRLNKNIVSAMGAGNRLAVPEFRVVDIYKTENDGLAKKMRKLLREAGVKNLPVVSSKQEFIPSSELGSISYFPAMAGVTIGAYVINEIIK